MRAQARRIAMGVLAAATAAACTTPPTGTGGGRGKAGPAIAATRTPGAGAASEPPAVGTPGPSGPGPGTITTAVHATLGVVRAPASLLANNGGGIVSDNGGGLVGSAGGGVVSNGGGAYRASSPAGAFRRPAGAAYRLKAAALDQVPVAGVTVALLDAAGAPVAGPDGKPLTAVTGADGAYRLEGAPRVNNLVVQVALPGAKGELRAIAPKGADDPVDLDVVSTLATAYILETYVATQAAPQATLDRLPREVEAATREKTGDALAATSRALPLVLTATAAVETLAALRRADRALDAQMEAVRKLLVLAGQADLGSGRPGTEVPLGYLRGAAAGPDGSLYISTYTDGRLWRLRPDGTIETALRFTPDADADVEATGRSADDSGIGGAEHLAVDAAGRLLIAESGGVHRLEADGKIKTLATKLGNVEALVAGAGDEAIVFVAPRAAGAIEVKGVGGGAVRAIGTFKLPATGETNRQGVPKTVRFEAAGRDDAGEIRVKVGGALYRFVPGAVDLEPIPGAPAKADLDANGHVFVHDDSTISRWAGGTTTKLAERVYGTVVEAGGRVYVVSDYESKVYRLEGGALVHVAGAQGGTGEGGTAATDFGFVEPTGLARAADGTLYISDLGYDRIYRLGTDAKVVTVAGSERCEEGDGCGFFMNLSRPATETVLANPRIVRMGPDGQPWFVMNGGKVYRLQADGMLARVYAVEGQEIDDFVVLPDGGIVASLQEGFFGGEGRQVVYHAPGATTDTTLLTTPKRRTFGDEDVALGLAPDGGVYVVGAGMVRRWKAGGTVETLHTAADPADGGIGPYTYPSSVAEDIYITDAMAAADAHGRLAIVRYDRTRIDLVDPAKGVVKPLVGRGGTIYTTGADALGEAASPLFTPEGDLLFVDKTRRQVRRVPAEQVVWP
jgi:sugar lactone lactonase YvrE